MFEQIKVCALAVGVCYTTYFVVYGIAYLLGLATGYAVAAMAGLVVLRMTWLVLRAAVRGRPVFEVQPEPNVTAPILGLGPEAARPAPLDYVTAEPDQPFTQRTPPLPDRGLVADTQRA